MHPAALIGAGFLAGTVGMKAVTSKKARKLYVSGIVQGLKVKDQCETMIEEAKAEFDDIMAEAEYEAKAKKPAEETVATAEEAPAEKE